MQLNNRSFLSSIAPVTKHLLIINVIMWLATIVSQRMGLIDLQNLLGLHFWKGSDFNVMQFFTYMFMHDTHSIAHLFFNMFSLWMFGSLLEHLLRPGSGVGSRTGMAVLMAEHLGKLGDRTCIGKHQRYHQCHQ